MTDRQAKRRALTTVIRWNNMRSLPTQYWRLNPRHTGDLWGYHPPEPVKPSWLAVILTFVYALMGLAVIVWAIFGEEDWLAKLFVASMGCAGVRSAGKLLMIYANYQQAQVSETILLR